MINKKFKIALATIIAVYFLILPMVVTQAQIRKPACEPQPLVYRFTAWWNGLHYNVLSGDRPDMKQVQSSIRENTGSDGATTPSDGSLVRAEQTNSAYEPRRLESALAVAVYTDTTLGWYRLDAVTAPNADVAFGPADSARAYVALVADGVAKDVKIYEPSIYRLTFDSTDNAQTPFTDSLEIDAANNTVQIVMASNNAGTSNGLTFGHETETGGQGAYDEDMFDIVYNSEILKVNGEVWKRVDALGSLPSSSKCYSFDYDEGTFTLKSLDTTDLVLVECVMSADVRTSEIDPGIRFGGRIYDNLIADTTGERGPADDDVAIAWPDTTVYRGNQVNDFFSSWGRVKDIEVLKQSDAENLFNDIHQYVNIYVLDEQSNDDSSFLFCYSHAKFDNGFSSLSIPYSQRYRGSLNQPTALSVISATGTNPGFQWGATGAAGTAPANHSNYTTEDSIRIFLTESGSDRIVVINGSIGIDETINTISSNLPTTHPDYGEYNAVYSGIVHGDQDHYLRYRTALGGSRLSFFPDTVTTTISGDNLNEVFFFNEHEESFSVLEWPKVWVDENDDGSYADSNELWQRVTNLTVVGDTGAYELDRFAPPSTGYFSSSSAFTSKGPGKITFGNGVHGRIPSAGNTWNVRVAYYPSPDMFVYDDTYADSTNGASGQISQPTGIDARYNEITGKVDVYVGDRGHQCVKKFEWSEKEDWSHRFRYVNKFADGIDPVSIAVGKYHKFATDVCSSEVYIYVADYANNTVKVYKDNQALAPEWTGAPEFVSELGGPDGGTELGQFFKPTDVYVVEGERFNNKRGASASGAGDNSNGYYGNKLDVYVADWGGNNSGRVTKIEGITNEAPTITNVSPLTAECSDCGDDGVCRMHLNHASSYDITYTATDDDLSTCTVDLYFAATDSTPVDSAVLIVADLDVPTSGRGSYTWIPDSVFTAEYLSDLPDTGYVLAEITDYYSQTDEDYSDCPVIVDDIVPSISFISDFKCQGQPGDSVIVIYEGEGNGWAGEDKRSIALYVSNPSKLTGFNVIASFDTSMINIESIDPGPLMDAGGEVPEFVATPTTSKINEMGQFAITGYIRFAGDDGGISKSGILARITYSVDTVGIDTDNFSSGDSSRYVVSDPGVFGELKGITIDEENSIMIKNGKDTLEVKEWKNATLMKTLLGDIADENWYDTYQQHKAPNMLPTPDGEINSYDILTYAFAWDGEEESNTGYQDPLADVYPAFNWKSGVRAPYLFPRPDCKWEADDVNTFSEMYSWYAGFVENEPDNSGDGEEDGGEEEAKKEAVASYQENLPLRLRYVSGSLKPGQQAVFDVFAKDVKNLKYAHASLDFDASEIDVRVENKDFMTKDADGALFKDAKVGRVDLTSVIFDRNSKGVNGSGVVATVYLTAKKEVKGNLYYSYELYNADKELMGQKKTVFDNQALARLGLPKRHELAQNYPNPFNPTTEIKFSLPNDSKVQLKIYNITGELVKTLVNDRRSAGTYTVTWNGENRKGRKVATGVYFYQIKTDDFTDTKKMVLMK